MAQIAKLLIEGKTLKVMHCTWQMVQDFNHGTGKILSKVRGGQISIEVESGENKDLSNFIWQYMIDPYKKCNGSLQFTKSDKDATYKELKFSDAYMIEMTESFNEGQGMRQHFTLSCRELSVDGATHKNDWEK